MKHYRPNLCAFLTFAVLASCVSCDSGMSKPGVPPRGFPDPPADWFSTANFPPLVATAAAQSPPMPVVVPVVPTPQPEPKPEPQPDAQPGVTIPAQTQIGRRLIATFCPPTDLENREATWRFFEVAKEGWIRPTDAVDALIEGDRAMIWAVAGNYRAEVICAGKVFTADFTVGEPKPPEPAKTLKELAGKDAAALAAVYQSMLPLAEQFGINKIATQFATAKLGELAKNPAAIEVAKRMAALGAPDDPVDVPRLKALLAAVIAELGAPGPAPDNELAKLVPNAEHRAKLAEAFESLASAVHAGGITTTGQLRAELQAKATQLKAEGLTGLSAVNAPISARIAAAVGLEDKPLDAATSQAAADALNKIAADFRGT